MKYLTIILAIILSSCSLSDTPVDDYTNIEIKNASLQDSVKVYLTLQSPTSVIGLFDIKKADTCGSKSQGFFYAKKDSSYMLDFKNALNGFNISFEAPPMSCTGAVQNGFKQGINIIEGSINVPYEVFDISCVDGANCIIETSVSDTVNWTTGNGSNLAKFKTTKNQLQLDQNCGIRGVFPYRCTDCIQINPHNVPSNCFDLAVNCSEERTCQVARTKHNGGTITIKYLGSESIGQ